jgi:LysM repeat protein
MDYSDAIRTLREIEQAPMLAAVQVRASSATPASGAIATPPAAAPGQLDPRWVKTANADLHNPAASAYDQTIKDEVDEYNRRFAGIPGFEKLDSKLFKAQLLTETGPANPQWLTLPAQMGKPGDKAYGVLKRNEERSNLVMSQRLQGEIATKSINDPVLNVKAAIAYVLTRAAHSRLVSRRNPTDTSEHKHIVKRGEVIEIIARREHTTVSELYADNPWAVKGINEGQTLTFYRASMVPEIYEFDKIDSQFIAKQYNSLKHDPLYANRWPIY